MNKYLRNFFFSGLVSQTESQVKKAFPNENFGKFISLSFLVGKDEKIIQRPKFEHTSKDSYLTESESKKFQKLLSIDVHKEMTGDNKDKKPCKSIFATIIVETKVIIIVWNYEDGTKRELTL